MRSLILRGAALALTIALAACGDDFSPTVEFTADEDRLTGEDTFEDVTIRLVLTKTD